MHGIESASFVMYFVVAASVSFNATNLQYALQFSNIVVSNLLECIRRKSSMHHDLAFGIEKDLAEVMIK